jgi:hypothetical protein
MEIPRRALVDVRKRRRTMLRVQEQAMRIWLLAVTLATTFATAAAAADRFDLSCAGQEWKDADGPPSPAVKTWRFDLPAGRFCEERCEHGLALQGVTPDIITMEEKKPERPLWATIHQYVSRTDGTAHVVVIADGYYYKFEGTCEARPFSGMPTPKF